MTLISVVECALGCSRTSLEVRSNYGGLRKRYWILQCHNVRKYKNMVLRHKAENKPARQMKICMVG